MFSAGCLAASRLSSDRVAVLKPSVSSVLTPARGSGPHFAWRVRMTTAPASGAHAAGERDYLDEPLRPLELVDAGIVDRADDRDRPALIFGQVDRDARGADVPGQLLRERGLELLDSEAAGLDSPGEGQIDKAAGVDADGFVRDLVQVNDVEDDLVSGAEDVIRARGERRRGRGGGLGSGYRGAQSHDQHQLEELTHKFSSLLTNTKSLERRMHDRSPK